jgi:hypothetical protein
MSIIFLLLKAILPPWGDVVVDIVEDISDDWITFAKAAKNGWQDEDEDSLKEAVKVSIDNIPGIPGRKITDSETLAAATAVMVRWIAHAPVKKRKGLRKRAQSN